MSSKIAWEGHPIKNGLVRTEISNDNSKLLVSKKDDHHKN